MIDRLFDFFEQLVSEGAPEIDHEAAIALSAASLMMEVARSDSGSQEVELSAIANILTQNFAVEPAAVEKMMSSAEEKVEEAHDLYQFTQLINEHYEYQDKEMLILAMWQVAYADGHIEAIEDHIIRRIAGLIHVAHADFIRLKIQARDA